MYVNALLATVHVVVAVIREIFNVKETLWVSFINRN